MYLADRDVPFPQIALLVSGGHCMLTRSTGPGRYELLGETVDDSIGEAYDKVARFLGLGYPGGPVLDRLAAAGEDVLGFPWPMLADGYAFSFSGLKTAVVNHVRADPGFSESGGRGLLRGGLHGRAVRQAPPGPRGIRRPRRGHRRRRGGQPHPARPGPGPGRRVRHPVADPAAIDGDRQRRHDRRGGLARAGRSGAERAGLRARAGPAPALRLTGSRRPVRARRRRARDPKVRDERSISTPIATITHPNASTPFPGA